MEWLDMMQMCLRNLYRRKGRTALTVSGVVIGCCAIMIMISLGVGMKESQEQMLAQMGNLTRITVSPPPGGSSQSKILLDKKAIASFSSIPNVKDAIGKKSLDLGELQLGSGSGNRYTAGGITIYGVSEKEFEAMGYQLKDGKFPAKKPFEVLIGQYFAYQFMDTKRPMGKNTVDYWMNEDAKPYFSPLKSEISIIKEVQTSTQGSGDENAAATVSQTKWKEIQKLTPVGILSENYDIGEETSYGMVMRISDLEKLQKLLAKQNGKKASKEFSQVLVDVNSINDVESAENSIKAMGYETSSMESIRKPMVKEAQQKQMMLGGLGAISLLVAAIGIANTMIMSITERTKEIGIMKALGCFLGDIKKEFLLEAASIGFLGGVLGILLSYLISAVMNYISMNAATGADSMDMMDYMGSMSMTGTGSAISIIPLWLTVFSLLFSILIGVVAGYYPASKAVRISALEAMKG